MKHKKVKSKDMQNHKIPTPKDLLQEEFGHEMGDVNASQIYGTLAGNKNNKKNKK